MNPLTNRALRLPVILVGFLAMAWTVQAFRPEPVQAEKPFRDASSVVMAQPASALVVAPTVRTLPIGLRQVGSWRLDDVAAVQKQGATTVLLFRDGSRYVVTPQSLDLMESRLRNQVTYEIL
jgi:hypothetical protein